MADIPSNQKGTASSLHLLPRQVPPCAIKPQSASENSRALPPAAPALGFQEASDDGRQRDVSPWRTLSASPTLPPLHKAGKTGKGAVTLFRGASRAGKHRSPRGRSRPAAPHLDRPRRPLPREASTASPVLAAGARSPERCGDTRRRTRRPSQAAPLTLVSLTCCLMPSGYHCTRT